MTQTYKPEIYVACKASRDKGILHGCWIAAAQELDVIQAEIKAILADSPAETSTADIVIPKFRDFAELTIQEDDPIENVRRIAFLLQVHGKPAAAFLKEFNDLAAAERAFENGRYLGSWSCREEYVRKLIEDTWDVEEYLTWYLDYADIARDLEWADEFLSIETSETTYIFLP